MSLPPRSLFAAVALHFVSASVPLASSKSPVVAFVSTVLLFAGSRPPSAAAVPFDSMNHDSFHTCTLRLAFAANNFAITFSTISRMAPSVGTAAMMSSGPLTLRIEIGRKRMIFSFSSADLVESKLAASV